MQRLLFTHGLEQIVFNSSVADLLFFNEILLKLLFLLLLICRVLLKAPNIHNILTLHFEMRAYDTNYVVAQFLPELLHMAMFTGFYRIMLCRVPAPVLPKPIEPVITPQRPLPKVDSFWSITIREHDVSYRWKEDLEQEEGITEYKAARRERYMKALQMQKEELGIGEKRKYLYAPIS